LLTFFIGFPAVITVSAISFIDPSYMPWRVVAVCIPWGILSLIVSRWVAKRITVPPTAVDEDEVD